MLVIVSDFRYIHLMGIESILKKPITRRKAIQGAILAGGVGIYLVGRSIPEIPKVFHPISSLNDLLGFKTLPPEFAVDPALAVITPNHPFLWRHIDSKERIDQEIEKASKLPTRADRVILRIFLDDKVEPQLGRYRYDLIDKVVKLAERVDLQIDFFDAYNLLHSDRPSLSYGVREPSSPYLGGREGRSIQDRKLAFFADPAMIEAFRNRVYEIGGRLKNIPGFKVISIGNEFDAPPALLNNWLERVLPVFKDISSGRPIIPGVADPTLIDEERLHPLGLTANTIHIYPNLLGSNLETIMARYLSDKHTRVMPLVCQEIGYPRLPGDIAYDWLSAQFLNSTLLRFVELNQKDGWIRPIITGVGPWKLATENEAEESDGHEIAPDEMPQTLGVLWTWHNIIEKSTFLANNVV